jgi:Domain of unknown function (DUF4413)
MLKTTLIYKDVFYHFKLLDAQYKTVPSEEDWENAKIMSEKLKVFYTTTELFSGTKYTTTNHYFKNICEIKLALTNWLTNPNPTIASMASRMLEKYEKYRNKIHHVMGVATLLDPRFKMKLLFYYYEKFYGDNSESGVEKVISLCRQLFREYQRRVSKHQVEEPIKGEGTCDEDTPNDFEQFTQRRKKGELI